MLQVALLGVVELQNPSSAQSFISTCWQEDRKSCQPPAVFADLDFSNIHTFSRFVLRIAGAPTSATPAEEQGNGHTGAPHAELHANDIGTPQPERHSLPENADDPAKSEARLRAAGEPDELPQIGSESAVPVQGQAHLDCESQEYDQYLPLS